MVAPDAKIFYITDISAGSLGQLTASTILVKCSHGEPAVLGDAWGMTHGDHAIGIAWIADDEDFCPISGLFLDGFALSDKDTSVDTKEVVALHPCFSWCSTHQQNPICIFECDSCIGGGGNFLEKWKGAIVQFHFDALKCRKCRFQFQKLQLDLGIWTKNGSGCNPK